MSEMNLDTAQRWDQVYSENVMTMWYPNEDVMRFCARLIKKRLTYDTYEIKRDLEHVLDLGCGNGRHVMFFARQGFQVAGIDISPQAIDWARDWCRREALAADVRVGNITQLPYADHAFEAVGLASLVRQAVESLAIGGTATVVGVLPTGAMIEFPWEALRPECKLQTSRMGSNRFRSDIPHYLDLYRQGRLRLDEMISRRGDLSDLNEAFRAMKAGEVARTVLTFD